MAVKEILLLGNPKLYEISRAVGRDEIESLRPVVTDLHDTMMEFRRRWGVGRAIAAPQIGVMKRLVYMHVERPAVLINPVFTFKSPETIELWDDCMSFPELLVRVRRHVRCTIEYRDLAWESLSMELDGKLSELLQHEVDHLDGILAVERVVDGKSFALRGQRPE